MIMHTDRHSMFRKSLQTPFIFLSLGGGVQSSTLALMAAIGKITPTPNAAIFADTQAEPPEVYAWLDWLEAEIQRSPYPFPIIRVTAGSLAAQVLRMRTTADGRKYSATDIPFFVRPNDGGPIGKIPHRSCTRDFKIRPINRAARELAGVKHKQGRITVTTWIGISFDELERARESRESWSQNEWPLCAIGMRREECISWMIDHGYPCPPRSACTFCPFHSDSEWRRVRDSDPESWDTAVQFERDLQDAKARSDNFGCTPYLHRQCVPLSQVDLTTDEERGQALFDFRAECSGLCGM